METDFNASLKTFFAKKFMTNAKKSGLRDEQWGGRRNGSPIDMVLINCLQLDMVEDMNIITMRPSCRIVQRLDYLSW